MVANLIRHKRRSMALAAMLATSSICLAQSLAMKNDAICDALLIPNIGMEIKTGSHTTIGVEGTYDPIAFPGKRKWKNFSGEAEFRRWGCKPLGGFFAGINAIGGGFNVERLPVFDLNEKRAQGYFYGGGFTVGFHRIFSPHWGIEAKADIDFAHISYSRYLCSECGYKERDVTTNYGGPTRVSLSLVYIIK